MLSWEFADSSPNMANIQSLRFAPKGLRSRWMKAGIDHQRYTDCKVLHRFNMPHHNTDLDI